MLAMSGCKNEASVLAGAGGKNEKGGTGTDAGANRSSRSHYCSVTIIATVDMTLVEIAAPIAMTAATRSSVRYDNGQLQFTGVCIHAIFRIFYLYLLSSSSFSVSSNDRPMAAN